MKNYYEILQVNEKATKEVIEKIYKVLVKKYHPDLQEDKLQKEELEKKLKEINEAYEILSDEFLRKQYDIELEKERQAKYKKKYGEKAYNTETGVNYKSNINKTNFSYGKDINTNKTNKPKKKLIYCIIDTIKELYYNKEKRDETKESLKKDIIALILTIIIVLLVTIILKINHISLFEF